MDLPSWAEWASLTLALISIVINAFQIIFRKILKKDAVWFANTIYSHAFDSSVIIARALDAKDIEFDEYLAANIASGKNGLDMILEDCSGFTHKHTKNAPRRLENWEHIKTPIKMEDLFPQDSKQV